MSKRILSAITLLVIASMLFSACGAANQEPTEVMATEEPTEEPMEEPTEEPTEEPVVIEFASVNMGALFPYSGALAEFGPGFENATTLAQLDLSAAGYDIELVFADTETNGTAATEAARQLVEVEGVDVLLGAASSGVSRDVANAVTIPNQVPQISYASTSPMLTYLPADEGQDFLFRTAPSDALQGPVLAQMIIDAGYTNVATLYVNNPYGQGLTGAFKTAFEALGGTVSAEVPHDEEVSTSYTAELQQAVAGDPEALVAISYPGHATIYMKEAIEGGFISTFVFVDGTKSLDIVTAVGAEAVEGMCGTAPGSLETESLAAFQSGWEAEFGELPPFPFLAPAYDAVVLAALAAYEAQVAGEDLTPIAIRDHLRSVSGPPGTQVFAGPEGLALALELLAAGEAIDFVGASGHIDLDEYGDISGPIEVWCYEDGEIVSKELVGP
jgi:ABC-type branched-subunit amino acid transport system substrate-binding protein